ncbi:MAG TPA: L-ribulose-5-phosphate 4-epimerase AraD [Candidatus Limnocylindrales bacterium]|jgi:L-ribulose-5-phosphate 4-epimerase|nr:L-ribulose-5-phosphate 4-epimerase AraD [Candidatus Limnocylindrales bacterium]
MLERLKRDVWAANLALVKEGLIIQTWGNASAVDRKRGVLVIKPSGVPYAKLAPRHMVVVSLESGRTVEGKLHPSSDTPTHLALYRAFAQIGGIVHTHSLFATAWAQTCQKVPAFGTTHADYFHGPIPCTRCLEAKEIKVDYEANTGKVIIEAFVGRDPLSCPGVLVASHGPFAWGRTVAQAVENAVVLEHLVRLAGETLRVSPSTRPMQEVLLEKHFFRKHGPGAYYGQAKPNKTANLR